MTEKLILTEEDIRHAVHNIAGGISLYNGRPLFFYGVPRGGIPVAYMLAALLDGVVTYDPALADYIVDDLIDSGATVQHYRSHYPNTPFLALYDKQNNPDVKGRWLVFPWERVAGGEDRSATDIVTRLFQYIGEDPNREGLRETPKRFLAAWKEWASGYAQDPADILKVFEDGAKGYDELVVVHNIPIISKCEHHLADITGVAHIGYIPNGRIIGLSKLARLAEVFARRLQVQERLTVQIADNLNVHLAPKGVGVIVRCAHACMSSRGVKIHNSVTTTSAMRGALLDKAAAREEFLHLCRMAERS